MSIHTLIIGGTRGLGKTLIKILKQENHDITVLARNVPENLDKTIDYFTADLLNPEQYLNKINEIFDLKKNLNHLVFMQRFRSESNSWEGELEVSLNATQNIIKHLKNRFNKKEASIVIVSSMAGKFATDSQPLSYAVAKAGLNQLVQHYALELGPLNIRVNAVSPCSFVKEESRQYYQDHRILSDLYSKIIPLRRMCHAEDVANVISFLCDKKSSFITGQNIVIDGGLSVINHESLARSISCV